MKLGTPTAMNEPTDEELGAAVRRSVEAVKAGATVAGGSYRIDGLWVVVSVEASLVQNR